MYAGPQTEPEDDKGGSAHRKTLWAWTMKKSPDMGFKGITVSLHCKEREQDVQLKRPLKALHLPHQYQKLIPLVHSAVVSTKAYQSVEDEFHSSRLESAFSDVEVREFQFKRKPSNIRSFLTDPPITGLPIWMQITL